MPADPRDAQPARSAELALAGHYRFDGDIGGNLTENRVPETDTLLARIRRDLGKCADALADIKAAKSMTKEIV